MHIFDEYLNDENVDKRERAKLAEHLLVYRLLIISRFQASLLKWHVNI